jgi:hypothetical protein
MNFVKWIQEGIAHPRLIIYLKGVAILMLLSAFSHLGSIMGIIGGSWVAKPWLFRLADLLLLPISLGGGRLAGSGGTLSSHSVPVLR